MPGTLAAGVPQLSLVAREFGGEKSSSRGSGRVPGIPKSGEPSVGPEARTSSGFSPTVPAPPITVAIVKKGSPVARVVRTDKPSSLLGSVPAGAIESVAELLVAEPAELVAVQV